jgi:hypothetical protein
MPAPPRGPKTRETDGTASFLARPSVDGQACPGRLAGGPDLRSAVESRRRTRKDQCHTRSARRRKGARTHLLFTMSQQQATDQRAGRKTKFALAPSASPDSSVPHWAGRTGLAEPDGLVGPDDLVEPDGIEPTTSCLQSRRSPN